MFRSSQTKTLCALCILVSIFIRGFDAQCSGKIFECPNDVCITRSISIFTTERELFCNSSKKTCKIPLGQTIGIPMEWECDGVPDCRHNLDEIDCPRGIYQAEKNLKAWFLNTWKNRSGIEDWKHKLHKTVFNLYLSDALLLPSVERKFIISDLSLQLLSDLFLKKNLPSSELAHYINALLAVCLNPQDFYGRNLVSELRALVERSQTPQLIEMISLCNAKDQMQQSDVDRIISACQCNNQAYCTETKALALIALSCLRYLPNITVDNQYLQNMASGLKAKKQANGTIVDLRTTALAVQALIAVQGFKSNSLYSSLKNSIKMIIDQQNSDGSFRTFLESYFILPVLSYESLISVRNKFCFQRKNVEIETNKRRKLKSPDSIQVLCSIFIEEDLNAIRSWLLNVPSNSTVYDALEILNESLDNKYRVKYNVVNGKPFIKEVFQIENDLEVGIYWYIYQRNTGSKTDPVLVESSAADVKVSANNEFILWYKSEDCNEKTE